MPFNIEISEHGAGIHVASLSGHLDSDSVELFEREIMPVISARPRGVILEMSSLEYIDSTALAALLRQRKALEDAGGRLYLCGLRQRIRDVIGVVRIVPDKMVFEDAGAAARDLEGR